MKDNRTIPLIDTAQPFQAVFENEELLEKMVESFPYPVQIFSVDGTAVRINRATLEMIGIRSVEAHVGKYNVFRDPLVRELGIMDVVRQVLTGKTVYLTDLDFSYQDMIRYFNVADKDIKTLHVDITCFPLMKPDHTVGCFVAIFFIKKAYRGREEIQRGKEYIENHWREKYDARKVAEAANLSAHHFAKLFKKHVGITPYDYYIDIKIRKIQERLRDPNLTIAEAFAACGVDYHGHFARVFKKRAGLTPSQYREAERGFLTKKDRLPEID
jgi:AraC family transcriptional regulator